MGELEIPQIPTLREYLLEHLGLQTCAPAIDFQVRSKLLRNVKDLLNFRNHHEFVSGPKAFSSYDKRKNLSN